MIAIEKEKVLSPAYEPLDLDFKLYLVTDRNQTGGRSLIGAVTDALKGGLRAVQLREKDLGTRDLLRLAYEMRQLTLKYDARLFINDRVDIAIAVDADGVQLTQKSMPPFAARRLSSRLIIGVSTHSLEEALKAQRSGADFITLGPVFATPSKAKYGEPLGVENFREIAKQVRVPVFAIGGITLENLSEVTSAGASGVAVISSVLGAKSIRSTAGKFIRSLE
ncbi:MAG: thiamine phosphate synthase [Nitrospirota bacterium]|jgi:thiamine-phosphate pyrophosphorylase